MTTPMSLVVSYQIGFDEKYLLCYGNGEKVRDMDTIEYNQRYEENLKRIKQLRLFDDDFFTKCFDGSSECVELLLHIILEKSDLVVEEVKVQYTIKNLQGRSVRLDVFAVDSTGRKYNIEVQRDDRGADIKRARHNSSLMDANALLTGDDTESMPENFVIFITEHDVIGKNMPVYHIDRVIRETGDLAGDGSHIPYVNGAWRDESPIGKLMHDFSCTDPNDMNYELLANRVRHFKEDKEGIRAMCKIWEEVRDEGAKENLLTNLKTLMETMHLSIEEAMDALRVPSEDRDSVRNRIVLP